jgi:hypothetical protein
MNKKIIRPHLKIWENWIILYDTLHNNLINSLKINSFVKVFNKHVFFWIIVKYINNDDIIGIVDNKLITRQRYHYGDKILFNRKNIFELKINNI